MVRKREIIVQKHEDGLELNRWLAKRYTYHTLEKWEEHIRASRILINGKEVLPETSIKHNDIVTYISEPIIEPPVDSNYGTIYEDDDLLVINKPCDIPCHPGGIYFEHTLWHVLKQKYDYISLVNRLDRETSGVMLIAKNKESAQFYFNQMMDRNIDKEYLVLVHGEFPKELKAKGYLEQDSASVIRKKRKFTIGIMPQNPASNPMEKKYEFCNTEFRLKSVIGGLSLVSCTLITGKTHQIRATLCSLGFPVVGDKIYGLDDSFFFKFINDELTDDNWKALKLKNQALHSHITVLPMLNGERKTFTAPTPATWDSILNCKS